MQKEPSPETAEINKNVIVNIAVDSWRFSRLFIRMLSKMDAADSSRYANQLNYFVEKLNESLKQADMQLVNIEGQIYDPGMAATALNIADFDGEDQLLVDQMLEPIIMSADGLIRSGTVMLRKAQI